MCFPSNPQDGVGPLISKENLSGVLVSGLLSCRAPCFLSAQKHGSFNPFPGEGQLIENHIESQWDVSRQGQQEHSIVQKPSPSRMTFFTCTHKDSVKKCKDIDVQWYFEYLENNQVPWRVGFCDCCKLNRHCSKTISKLSECILRI